MSSYKLETYPQDKYRFALYDNMDKLTRQEIKRQTGCYALVNLWYFHLTKYTHECAVMLHGKWEKKPAYDWPGICITPEGRVSTGGIHNAAWDYAASVQADYVGGKRTNTTGWERNGVTYTGIKADGSVVCMLASKDDGMASDEAVSAMLGAGCVDILRWDGSWSSQGSLGPGLDVQPSQKRICRGWLLIFKRDPNQEEEKPVSKVTVDYMTKNDCYKAGRTITPEGIMVHSTAAPGRMAADIRDDWDKSGVTMAVHAFVDNEQTIQTLPWNFRGWHAGIGSGGKSANNTHISLEICEPPECRLLPIEWVPLYRGNPKNPTWAVKRLQMELAARGYDPNGTDGSFGPGCEAALKACQKALGLTADGSCGPGTLAALAKREGSYLAYNVKANEPYFRAAWARAVSLCAERCKQYGFDPLKVVLCHCEGYKKGIASNHADVMHWFPLHGESMDSFRAAVKTAMAGAVTPPPDPLAEAVAKLQAAGIIIDNPENANYWKGGSYSAANVQALIIKMAAAV